MPEIEFHLIVIAASEAFLVEISGELVEEEINGGNLAVASNDEISAGVRRRLTRAARDPSDPAGVSQFLGVGN